MKRNPYTPPKRNVVVAQQANIRGNSRNSAAVPLLWLFGIAMLTLLLAWVDAVQERVPGFVFTLQVTLGAVVAQIPGMVCGELHRRKNNRNTFTFLVPAFCIAGVSLLIYVMYVLAGRVQTPNNTEQMHVILIPILLVLFAFVAYLVTVVVWAVIKPRQNSAG